MEDFVTAAEINKELGTPPTTLYRLVTQGLVRAHPLPRLPHHRRPRYQFLMSEVREDLANLPRAKSLRDK
jgi:hypothetical protein